MKVIPRLLTLAVLLATAQISPAAAPSSVNYQGRFTNLAGVPQPGIKAISLRIYDAATAGTQLYSETVGNVTVDTNGVYSFQFGASGADTPASLANALATSVEQWLELTVDGAAQAPRQKILAVPFALMAGGLPDGAVSSAMIADGAVGLSKITGLGTAATAASGDFTGSVPPGPFADTSAAISGGVGWKKLYLKTSGGVDWVDMDADAEAYMLATGITSTRALQVSEFLVGLDSLGLRSNLLDGACYRADTQASAGTTAHSLLGLSNITLVGSPARRKHGLYFNGTSSYGHGASVTTTGARSLLAIHASNAWNATTTVGPVIDFQNSTQTVVFGVGQNGSNFYSRDYGGGVYTEAGIQNGFSRITTSKAGFQALRDTAVGGASQFTSLRLPHDGVSFTRATGIGPASNSMNKIRVCVTANSGLTTITNYVERTVSGWLLFNKALTDQEELDVQTLLGQTIFPKWKLVWEGDSVDNHIRVVFDRVAETVGNNAHNVDLHAGGQKASDGVAQLGTVNGFTDANLTADVGPVVAIIGFGANDLATSGGNRTPAATHADMRTMWAYAKARGATVCARTVTPFYEKDTERGELNALIRADEGIYYDVLLDLAAYVEANAGANPEDNTDWFYDTIHPVISVANKGGEWMASYIAQQLELAGVMP